MSKKYIAALSMLILAAMFTGCSNTPNEPAAEQTILESVTEEYTVAPDNQESMTEILSEDIPVKYDSLFNLKSSITSKYSNETLQYPSSNENFEYNVYETYIQITKYIGNSKDVVFPNTIDGLPVKIIGDQNWTRVIDYESNSVNSITFEPGIEIIYDGAFSFMGYVDENGHEHDLPKNLKKVSLPDGLLYIGNEAFYNCRTLSELKLPESLLAIGTSAFAFAFAENANVSVTIPEKLNVIGSGAFYSNYTALTDITILSDDMTIDYSEDSTLGNIIPAKSDGIEITIHGHAGSTAAQIAADTKQKFVIINN